MGARVWIEHQGTEYEWDDAIDGWTGNARPLTDERRQELVAHQLRAEEIARSWGWNGEHGVNFGILRTDADS